MKVDEIVTWYLSDDPRKCRVRLRDELNHCARTLGCYSPRKDYDSKEAIAMVNLFKKTYPPRAEAYDELFPSPQCFFIKEEDTE